MAQRVTYVLNLEGVDKFIINADRAGQSVRRIGTDAEEGAGKATRGFSMMHSSLKGLLGTVGISGVLFGMKDLVNAGMNLQEHQAQLRSTLKAVGITGASAFNKINEAAIKSAEHGGFTRDQELESITQFVSLTKSSTQAIKDNSLAIAFARRFHQSYTLAQRDVTLALSGHTIRLQRYLGIIQPVTTAVYKLTQAHKLNMLALEQESKALPTTERSQWLRSQEIAAGITPKQLQAAQYADKIATSDMVMKRIQTVTGGAIDAWNRSTRGKLSNLKNTFDEVMGAIGKSLLPAVNKILDVGLKMIGWMDKNKVVAIAFAGVITTLATAALARTFVKGISYAVDGLKSFVKWSKITMLWTERQKIMAGITAIWETVAALATGDLAGAQAALAAGVDATSLSFMGLMAIPLVALLVAIGFGIYELVKHFGAVKDAVGTAFKFIWHTITSVWDDIKKWGAKVFGWITWPFRKAIGFVKSIAKDLNPFHWISKGIGAVGNFFGGLFHSGGKVGHFATGGPIYRDFGGPVGTDTVPAWLTPGEYVLNRAVVQQIGVGTLNRLNAGGGGLGGGGAENLVIQPAPVFIQLNSKTIARAVVQYTLERAARGPSSLVGGALSTGV